ncbi:I78 family peptidase inhibitor [Alkalisalibacterium limincola]|nr:I78 family peptidase inhibitor [Alkalisalibacterium limincola]
MVRATLFVLVAMGLAGCSPDREDTLPHEVPEAAAPAPAGSALPPPTMDSEPSQRPRPGAAGQEGAALGGMPEYAENGMGCDESKAQWIIGEEASQELLDRAAADAGAEVARYIRHDEMVTMEYHASRLNVMLDEQGRAASVRCG